MATTLFSPRLFLSYSRADRDFAGKLATDLCRRGFRVFLDTSDIDPGDNFVSKLTKEIKRSTAVIAVVSENYSLSRWGQAELYSALAGNKGVIPVLISPTAMSGLDEPLQRLLWDTQYVAITGEPPAPDEAHRFGELLAIARRQYRKELFNRLGPVFLGSAVVLLAAWCGKDYAFSMSSAVFRNVDFFGGEIQAINAIDVSFVNTKFRSTAIDTTNFSKGPLHNGRAEGRGQSGDYA
jgi:hypothetical protein